MINWNFSPDRPISLTLAADARLSRTIYTNDQIWELNFGNSEPPALSLQTTFGLRARICRIFPRFIKDSQVITDPVHFYRPITIHKYFPNYLSLSFRPLSFINVEIEYWVPSSQVIAGRSKITNTSHDACNFQLEWVELLIPSSDGKRMAAREVGLTTILSGQTSNLTPVLFLTGGAQAGNSPYPSLNLSFEIPPHAVQESRWVNASLEDVNASFELTKGVINKNWEAEFSRIERINSQGLEITTGNHEWNLALFLAQTISHQLILQPADLHQPASFVYSRHPDQGFSLRLDGSDYNYQWNGQTAFDSYYLANFLLPSSPDILRGVLDNFFAAQTPQGEIDWKPGLGGQRSQLLSTPLLTTLAWMYYRYSADITYLRDIFPQLTKFFFSWFTNAHDRDEDLIPEWDQAHQTGFEEHPLFSNIHPWLSGLDCSTVESPDLVAYLYRESQLLISIAKLLEENNNFNQLVLISEQLKNVVEQSWSDQLACYLYRDRDSHLSTQGEVLAVQNGSGVMELHREFQQPIRPMLVIKGRGERTQPIQVYIHGSSPAGIHRVDHIPAYRIRWHLGSGYLTSEYIYQTLEQIEIMGILDDVEVIARSADLTRIDHTLLLPLWAGIPAEDRVKILINLTILNKKKFLSPYGLRSTIEAPVDMEVPDEYFAVLLPWNSLILEGLVHYGMYEKASEVFTRLMKAVLHSLKQEMKFHPSYHCETGMPMGTANSLPSLIPVGLFLKILGINIISPTKVEITNGNPFPWPVTIKYRGLTIVQQAKKALVIFPDGQNLTVENSHPQIITMQCT